MRKSLFFLFGPCALARILISESRTPPRERAHASTMHAAGTASTEPLFQRIDTPADAKEFFARVVTEDRPTERMPVMRSVPTPPDVLEKILRQHHEKDKRRST